MTNESRITRTLVILVLGAATGGMIAVSLRANYLFGYGFGQTPEKAHVFGFANVAADIWKAAGLIVITSLWRAKQKRFAHHADAGMAPVFAVGPRQRHRCLCARSHATHRRPRGESRELS